MIEKTKILLTVNPFMRWRTKKAQSDINPEENRNGNSMILSGDSDMKVSEESHVRNQQRIFEFFC